MSQLIFSIPHQSVAVPKDTLVLTQDQPSSLSSFEEVFINKCHTMLDNSEMRPLSSIKQEEVAHDIKLLKKNIDLLLLRFAVFLVGLVEGVFLVVEASVFWGVLFSGVCAFGVLYSLFLGFSSGEKINELNDKARKYSAPSSNQVEETTALIHSLMKTPSVSHEVKQVLGDIFEKSPTKNRLFHHELIVLLKNLTKDYQIMEVKQEMSSLIHLGANR